MKTDLILFLNVFINVVGCIFLALAIIYGRGNKSLDRVSFPKKGFWIVVLFFVVGSILAEINL